MSVCVRMRMKSCRMKSCMLAFMLACNAAAEIIQKIVEEKTSVSLRCPQSVEGTVMWSRESNGRNVNILTAGVDQEVKHIHDPYKRYGYLVDKSLYISRVNVSDSGRYFCNGAAAVDLTVIPPGTTRLDATERTDVTLTCPPDAGGSDIKTWSNRNTDKLNHQRGFYVSPVDQTLTISSVELKDSGLYYCNGKPVYLNVIKGKASTTTPTRRQTTEPPTPRLSHEETTRHEGNTPTTTTLTTTPTRQTTTTTTVPLTTRLTNEETTTTKKQRHNKKDKKNKKKGNTTTTTTPTTTTNATSATTPSNTPLGLMFGIIVAFLLLLIIIIVVYFARRRRIKRRGSAERCAVYDEIQDASTFPPGNGGGSLAGPTATYAMIEFPDGLDHNDHTYSTIPDLPRAEKKSETSMPNDSTYSFIDNPLTGGINNGPSQLPDNTYFLLEKSKAP